MLVRDGYRRPLTPSRRDRLHTTGWTPSPANAAWGPHCYLVSPERSTSLFRCVDLCKEHGGTPACIGSAEENDFVTAKLAAADGLWLGLYQNETLPRVGTVALGLRLPAL